MNDEFKNPSNKYRAKPFWAWNGKLDEAEIKRQVDILGQMGFGGFFMHSRVGLVTEYLGDEWFEITKKCADYAKEKGLESWIYDEDRWPSGSAGGMATRNPEYRMKFIRLHEGEPVWDENLIAAFSCRIEGLNIYDIREISKEDEVYGDKVWFDIVEFPCAAGFNGTTYLDTMKREATDEFIRLTHERYRLTCGDRIGTSIKGIFTDEPHRGEVMVDMELSGQNIAGWTPYTDSLFAVFKKRWGGDLRRSLPLLFYRDKGETVSKIKWQYCETIQELFLDNFMKPVSKWCLENGMLFTGHLLHENTLSSQAIMNGSMMRNYEFMDIPGVDVLGLHNHNYNIVKQLASAAHQTGKKWMLSELYGCSGWQASFEDFKRAGDWQALLGINFRCPHLSWYSMQGQRKRDYPASISFHSSWYKEYRHIEDYFARLAVFMEKGEVVCRTLVINPVESMWCSIHKGWAKWLETTSEECLCLERQYKEMYGRLLADNVEYDYGDEDMLARLGHTENGVLYLGSGVYTHVLVSGMTTMRSTTYKLLKEFERQGGKVVVEGQLPSYIDASPARISFETTGYNDILKNRLVFTDNKDIFSSVRSDGCGRYYVMLLNMSDDKIRTHLYAPKGCRTQYLPESGECFKVSGADVECFEPGEMKLLEIDTNKPENEPAKSMQYEKISLAEKFDYELSEPNVLVIDRVKCEYEGESLENEVLRVDSKLRDHYGIERRSGNMYQPWYQYKLGIKRYCSIKLEYEFVSEIETDAYLAAEQMERGNAQFNGASLKMDGTWWIDPCLKKYRIHIVKGVNRLTVNTCFSDDTDIEAVYILGEFGVYNNVLKEKPCQIGYGDITQQGFPYYGGNIKYIFSQQVKKKSVIELKNLCGSACMKVNGKLIAWAPYKTVVDPCDRLEIELFLTRRNTFGPFHLYPKAEDASPRSFVSEGEHWTDQMMLIANGLERC